MAALSPISLLCSDDMAENTKRLVRLMRLQTQLNQANRSKLISRTAEQKRLVAEREYLNDVIGGENLTTKLYPQFALRRMEKIIGLESDSSAEIDQLAQTVNAGKMKIEHLQERLAKCLEVSENKNLELDFLERLSRASDGQ